MLSHNITLHFNCLPLMQEVEIRPSTLVFLLLLKWLFLKKKKKQQLIVIYVFLYQL